MNSTAGSGRWGLTAAVFVTAVTVIIFGLGCAPAAAPNATATSTIEPTATPVPASTAIASSGTAVPVDPSTQGLSGYPDEPVVGEPPSPMPIQYLIEHRSALNGRTVRLEGLVTGTLLGEDACPPDRGGCAHARIFLGDTLDPHRDPNLDVMVLVSMDAQPEEYPIGSKVTVQGVVYGTATAVYLDQDTGQLTTR